MKPSFSTKFPSLTGAVISTCTLSQGSPSPYPRKLTTIGFVAVLKLTRVSRTLNSLQVHYRYIKNTYMYIYICIYFVYICMCMSEFPFFAATRTRDTLRAITSEHDTVESDKATTSQRAITHSSIVTLKYYFHQH